MLSTDANQPVLRTECIDTVSGGWDQIKDTTLGWAHIVRATWLLMTQPGVTDVDDQLISRTVRRRAEREGYNPNPVRVVRIHHHARHPQPQRTVRRPHLPGALDRPRPLAQPVVSLPARAPPRVDQPAHHKDSTALHCAPARQCTSSTHRRPNRRHASSARSQQHLAMLDTGARGRRWNPRWTGVGPIRGHGS